MKRIALAISLFFFMGALAGAQNPFEAPSESYEIKLDPGWNTLSIPASDTGYMISLSELLDTSGERCELKYGKEAFTFEGKGVSSNTIEAQKGYAVYVENADGCSMEFKPSELTYSDQYSDNGIEKIRTDSGWKVVSTPREMTLSDYKEKVVPECELADSVQEGVEAYEIDSESFENVPLSESDSMQPENVYWIKTPSSCDMDMSDYAGSSEDSEDSETDDSGSTSDSEDTSTTDDSDWGERRNLNDHGFEDWVFRHNTIETDLSEVERPDYTYDESSGVYTLTLEGRDSVCGAAKWTREFENSDYDSTQSNKFVEIDIKVKDLSTGTSGQNPQTVFVNLDGDRVFEKLNPSSGAEYNVREQMDSSGNTVEIGVEDMDSTNCFDFDRRTSVTITVETALEPAF